jgi:hypothetical protein
LNSSLQSIDKGFISSVSRPYHTLISPIWLSRLEWLSVRLQIFQCSSRLERHTGGTPHHSFDRVKVINSMGAEISRVQRTIAGTIRGNPFTNDRIHVFMIAARSVFALPLLSLLRPNERRPDQTESCFDIQHVIELPRSTPLLQFFNPMLILLKLTRRSLVVPWPNTVLGIAILFQFLAALSLL